MTRTIRNSFFPLIFFLAFSIEAQIKVPATPQYENQGYVPYYFNSAVQGSQIYSESSNSTGLKEDPILNSQRQAWQAMGYNPPVAPPSDPTERHAFLMNQLRAEMSSLDGNRDKHLLEVMNELHEINYSKSDVDNSGILADYQNAFSQIYGMLKGIKALSFTDATYYSETAYGNPYLNRNEFTKAISQSADFIKRWLKENNYAATQQNVHYAIQQFMGDTLSFTIKTADIKHPTQTTVHYPFKYDFNDYDGKVDYRNYFSTKCLATGTGQCSSMPIVYLMLCEALGVQGYLTFAPFHSFIKFKNSQGKIQNYEPTAHWILSDKWYQEHLGVSQKAKMKGIYLDTINRKQAVANSLVDLAISYMLKTPRPDTAFVIKCLATAQKHFPKNNNVYIYLAKSSLLYRQLDQAMKKHGLKDISEVNNFPDTRAIYIKLMNNESQLAELGYEELPKSMYDSLIEQQANKTNDPQAKIKKTLFKQTN